MILKLKRSFENPILVPDSLNQWEAEAAFNPSVIKEEGIHHMVYRAQSTKHPYFNYDLQLSSIGYASSPDPIHFQNKKQLIKPEHDWEKFGCEDPRMTKIGDRYFIFYTALSTYPFGPEGIKVGLAITKDFDKIEEKYPITTFNSKGMALFPEKINGKFAAILTVDTDKPPAKICIAYFDKEEQIWDPDFWNKWYIGKEDHTLNLLRDSGHQVEVGAVPVKTSRGWLLVHAYIKEYFTPDKIFGIEAALLDLNDPKKVIARTPDALLTPREEYELYGSVPYTIFPTSAMIEDGELFVYYGSTDTTSSVASVNLDQLLDYMVEESTPHEEKEKRHVKLERFEGNPIISPIKENSWESKATFNPAAIYEGGKVHILYRAMGNDDTSVIGYASSSDGEKIDERLPEPVYVPREEFEKKAQPGNSGCEDARLTKVGNRIYMFYTAYNGRDPTTVAMASIKVSDFLKHDWKWDRPVIVSPREVNDKNACILPEKVNGKYVIFHRTNHMIWVDTINDLKFDKDEWVQGNILLEPKEDVWYSEKVGIGAPPLKTDKGWLLIFHSLSKYDLKYRLGAILLDLKDPLKMIAKLEYPILEPETDYENLEVRPGTVFACGAVIIEDKLLVYYGGGDQAVAVASTSLSKLLSALEENPYSPEMDAK